MTSINDKTAFHIHTYRCGHAQVIPDEAYVQQALSLGASSIFFADHAPFPGDPFTGRMCYDQLKEYIDSIQSLKRKYHGSIDVVCGLEIEYLPSYDADGYYQLLLEMSGMEFLLLGQHMAEDFCDGYTFQWDTLKLNAEEHKYLADAICKGLEKGYFSAVAHPDRIFRRCPVWTTEMETLSKRITTAAKAKEVPLEFNLASLEGKNQHWDEFWEIAVETNNAVIPGLDAHTIDEMKCRYMSLSENGTKKETLAAFET